LIGGTSTPILNLIGGATTDPIIGYGVGALRFGTTTGAGSAGFSEKVRITADGKLLVGTSSAPDAQVGIASGNGWVYRTYTFLSGGTHAVTVSAGLNSFVEITVTLISNGDIAQAKTLLGRRDINPHRSATANVVGSVITQTISSTDAGDVRTWTINYGHSTDVGNKHWMFEIKSLNTQTISVT
jgi:hypothetical protein